MSKKKLVLISILLIIAVLFTLTGCNNTKENKAEKVEEETAKVEGLTDENKFIYDFIVNNPVYNSRDSKKLFYYFGEDGTFIESFGLNKMSYSETVLFIKGTWKLEGKDLIITPNECAYWITNEDGERDVEYRDYKLKQPQTSKNIREDKTPTKQEYLRGEGMSLYKANIEKEEYVNEVVYYLKNDLKDVNIEHLTNVKDTINY